MRLVLECDLLYGPGVCCYSRFVRLSQRFSFLLAVTGCLLYSSVTTSLAFGSSLNCHSLTLYFFFPFQWRRAGSQRVNFIYIRPIEVHFLHGFTSNSPPDMSSSMCCFVGDINHLILILDTAQATTAIVAGLGFVSITSLMIITVALYLTQKPRGPTRERRGSATTSVIDICRLTRSSVERQSCVAEPHRPPEAYRSSTTTSSPDYSRLIEPAKAWQSSSSIGVVSKHEDALWRTGLHKPSGYVVIALDLEAQSWKPTMEKINAKAELPRSLSVELPISPPPSYSQIDRSVLVSVP